MKVFFTLIATFALAGCYKPAETSSTVGAGAFQVERLFTYDGCTMYRFEDAGYPRYFTRCESATSSTTWSETRNCGKGCARAHDMRITTPGRNMQ